MVRLTRPLLASVVTAAALACSEERPAPSSPTPPVPEPNRDTNALSILGAPATLHIGQTAQLRAMAQYVDGGGYVDVTQQASWQSSNDQACRVSAGMLTSVAAGTSTISAQFGATSATAKVACGYVITARVHENPPTLDVMLQDALVEVVGGTLDGQTFLTDAQGRAVLPPVGGAGFWLYFKRRGYDDLRYEIFELPRQSELDISLLRAPDERVEFSGPCTGLYHTLHFGLSLPREGRVRASLRTSGGPATAPKVCARLLPNPPSNAYLEICDLPAYSVRAEDILLPGNYELEVVPFNCPVGVSWSLTVEHPR